MPEGGDVAREELVVPAGTVLGPRQLGLLAATGHAAVPARPRPRVVVLSSGGELRELGRPLGLDSVHDANSVLLAASATTAGGIAYRVGILPTEPEAFREALEDQLVRADLVVATGETARRALAGAGPLFTAVAMRPGGIHGFGYVGPDRTPLLALPGNPVAAWVSFQLFGCPAIRRLSGLHPEEPVLSTARLTEPVTAAPSRRQYLRGVLGRDDAGGATVSVAGDPDAHLLGDLAVATCLIVVPDGVSALGTGADVEVLAFDD